MNENYSRINPKDILNVFKRGLLLFILLPLLAAIICGYINLYHLPPVYRASTILMVGKINGSSPVPPITTDSNAIPNDTAQNYDIPNTRYPPVRYDDSPVAAQLVNTYSEIARSRAVSNQVIAGGGLKITPEELRKKISVDVVKNTQLISLNVTHNDPKVAALLANRTAMVFAAEIQRMMQSNTVTIIDPAIVPSKPFKPNILLNTTISGLLGLFLAIMIFFLITPFKQTFQSSKEAEEILSLPVLGTIPEIKKPKFKFNRLRGRGHYNNDLKS